MPKSRVSSPGMTHNLMHAMPKLGKDRAQGSGIQMARTGQTVKKSGALQSQPANFVSRQDAQEDKRPEA